MTINNIEPTFPMRRDIHVVPSNKMWAVKLEGEPYYYSIFNTQREATSYAVSMAKVSASLVIIHGQNGQFRDVRNYTGGNADHTNNVGEVKYAY